MRTISIANILKETPDLTKAGTVFYDLLSQSFADNQNVIVDMTNVSSMPSIFLNVSIGKIIDEHSIDLLKSQVSFSNINRAQALRLKEYLEKFN